MAQKDRGDGDKKSNIDLLMVIDKKDQQFDDQICEMMTDICLRYNFTSGFWEGRVWMREEGKNSNN